MTRSPAGGPRVPGEGYRHRPDDDSEGTDGPVVGVLAVQGDVLEHLRMLRAVGVRTRQVRSREQLAPVDALVLPGGESTTMGRIITGLGLDEAIRERVSAGMPVLGTCAGGILLARAAWHADGRVSNQPLLGLLDVTARRNAFGRQVASAELDVHVAGLTGEAVHAAFIRAPWFEEVGDGVEVLATVATAAGEHPVVVREGRVLATAFHPELTGDSRLHACFVSTIG